MSELERQTSPGDQIAALHRMSTTAGVAAQEYVAINTMAVASMALGLFTLLALVSTLFLIIGVAALGCGIVAFYQIRGSNGTQSGRSLAVLGMLLALGISGYVTIDAVRQAGERQRQTEQINAVLEEVGTQVKAGRYAEAYALFNAEFQKQWTVQQFEQIWKLYQDPDSGYGPVRSVRGNNIVIIHRLGDGTLEAQTRALVQFTKGAEPMPAGIVLQQAQQGTWQVSFFGQLFAKSQR
jgi:hypothetical protein